jgi:hypothetical protein
MQELWLPTILIMQKCQRRLNQEAAKAVKYRDMSEEALGSLLHFKSSKTFAYR